MLTSAVPMQAQDQREYVKGHLETAELLYGCIHACTPGLAAGLFLHIDGEFMLSPGHLLLAADFKRLPLQ